MHAPGGVDHRADIYALGVVFYQMLTGELPGKKIEPPSKKVQIDVRLDEIVLRALEKNPELRYQQVSEVKTMVETIVATPPGSSRREEAQTEKPQTAPPATDGQSPEVSVTPGFTKPEAEQLGREIGAVLKDEGLSGLIKKGLLRFADQMLLLFDFTANIVPLVERDGRRRFNFWPFLLLFCSSIGFMVNGGIVVINVLQRAGRGANPFTFPVYEVNMLLWAGIFAVGRLAALNLGGSPVAGGSRSAEAKKITRRRMSIVFRRLLMLAVLGGGSYLLATWLCSLPDLAQAKTALGARWLAIAIGVGLAAAVVWWYVRLIRRVQGEVAKAQSAVPHQNPLPVSDFWEALEAGNYGRAWDKTALYFQRDQTRDEWVARMEKDRRRLGKSVAKGLVSTTVITPMVRTAMEILTTFENGQQLVEGVFSAVQPDGEWRVEKYYARPATSEAIAKAQANSATRSRFSRTAIVGVCFGILGMLAFVLYAVIGDSNLLDEGPSNVLAAFWVLCLLISTILGWVAVSQIRRPAANLHGMWLAVFNGLLFPLLALDGLITFLAGNIIDSFRDIDTVFVRLGLQPASDERIYWLVGIATVFICVVSNTMIVWGVWRAVNKRRSGCSPAGSENSIFGKWAWGPFVGGTLGSSLLITILPWQEGLAAAIGSVALALALVWGLKSWRERSGKVLVIATSVLFVASVVVAAVFWFVIVPAKRDRLQAAFGPVTECTLPMDENGWTPLWDLDYNRFVPDPKPSDTAVMNVEQHLAPLKKPGVAIHYDGQIHIIAVSGVVIHDTDDDQWKRITDMGDLAGPDGFCFLSSAVTVPGAYQTCNFPDKLPLTIFFKTGACKLGLLQITGFTNNPPGVKIRYKLAQSTTTPSVTPTSALQFRLVAPEDSTEPTDELPGVAGATRFRVLREVLLDDSAVAQAGVDFNPDGTRKIEIQFTAAGKQRFAQITATNISHQLAVVFRGKVLCAPFILSALTDGQCGIDGNMSREEVYALLDCLNRTTTASDQAWKFTAPRERILPFQPPPEFLIGWLDLDSGTILTNSKLDWQSHAGHEWIRTNGLDVVATESSKNIPVLLGVDLVLAPAPTNGWDIITAADVGQNWTLMQQEPRQEQMFGAPPGQSGTFLFQTREGGMGILQITGFSDNPPGVKIRYKLVQNANPPLKTAGQILAEQPPVVVEAFPVSGARDVAPGETEIRVRFSKPMADGSWSWSTAWENSTPELVGPAALF